MRALALWALATLLLLGPAVAARVLLSGGNTSAEGMAADQAVAAGASGRAAAAVGSANRRLHGAGADQTSCSFEPAYCGGGDCPDGRHKADPGCQISCSPFPVKVSGVVAMRGCSGTWGAKRPGGIGDAAGLPPGCPAVRFGCWSLHSAPFRPCRTRRSSATHPTGAKQRRWPSLLAALTRR